LHQACNGTAESKLSSSLFQQRRVLPSRRWLALEYRPVEDVPVGLIEQLHRQLPRFHLMTTRLQPSPLPRGKHANDLDPSLHLCEQKSRFHPPCQTPSSPPNPSWAARPSQTYSEGDPSRACPSSWSGTPDERGSSTRPHPSGPGVEGAATPPRIQSRFETRRTMTRPRRGRDRRMGGGKDRQGRGRRWIEGGR
jgi:hypothetical protein